MYNSKCDKCGLIFNPKGQDTYTVDEECQDGSYIEYMYSECPVCKEITDVYGFE